MILVKSHLVGLLGLALCVAFTSAQNSFRDTEDARLISDVAHNEAFPDLSHLSRSQGKSYGAKSNGKLPMCARCRSGKDCQSGKCWGSPRKCVQKSDYRWLTKCGFKKECQRCSSAGECATKYCSSPGGAIPSKCIFRTRNSKEKCFAKVPERPQPTRKPRPTQKPKPSSQPKRKECARCKSSSECATGKCYGSPKKCVGKTDYKWLKKCGFKTECKKCRSGLECATKKCSKGVCVRKNAKECSNKEPKPTQKPKPTRKPKLTKKPSPTQKPAPKKECEPCKSSSECAAGQCYGSPKKCVGKPDYKWLVKCGFKTECKRCRSGLECASKKCDKGLCVRKSASECDIVKPEPTVNPKMPDVLAV